MSNKLQELRAFRAHFSADESSNHAEQWLTQRSRGLETVGMFSFDEVHATEVLEGTILGEPREGEARQGVDTTRHDVKMDVA